MNALAALKTIRWRRIRAHSRRWQRRAIFTGGAFLVGILAVGLAGAADEAAQLFRGLYKASPLFPLVVTPFGFAVSAWLTRHVFPNTQGSGIPQAIAARSLKTSEERRPFVGLRAAIGKIVLTLLGLLVGASVGREGPTVQIGASVMFSVGQLAPRRQPGLILAGAAAGVAAAFNTPLAGIVFAIEEISRSFEIRTSGLIIGAVILAGLTSLALVGDYDYFGFTTVSLPSRAWLAVPVAGVLGGILGGGFSRILIFAANGLPGHVGRWIEQHPTLFALFCGLLVALIGILSNGQTYGTGYLEARAAVHDAAVLPFAYAPLKFLATAITGISGIAGGIFSPSLSVGAGLGSNLAALFPSAPLGALVLLGMVGYFSGVVQAPITSFVIVSEVTSDHHMIVPLMATALLGSATSRFVCREGIYHALAKRYLPRSAAPVRISEGGPNE